MLHLDSSEMTNIWDGKGSRLGNDGRHTRQDVFILSSLQKKAHLT